MKKYYLLPLLTALLSCGLLSAQTIISVPADATPVEKNAAGELAKYLGKIYPEKFEFKPNAADASIRVGSFSETAPKGLGNDGFEIVSDGKKLNIRGGTREGTGNLFGVYEYLESLGCRFMTATEEFIPRKKEFSLPVCTIRQKPSFELFRLVICAGRFGIKMRMNGTFTGVATKGMGLPFDPAKGILRDYLPYSSHTTFFFMPPEKYGKVHPEYYAVHSGRRSLTRSTGELCLSNPDMTAEFIRNCREYLKKRWRKGMILVITPEDNQNFCQCPACRKINAEEKTNGGTLIRFVNKVAAALEKDWPDLVIKTNAYQYHRFPPAKTGFRKNVALGLANIECDYAKAFTGAPENEKFLENLKQWKKYCSRMILLDYGTTFDNYFLPVPNFDALSERLKTCRKLGVQGVSTINVHTEPVGEFHELRSYLTARMFWNADADPWKVAEDFCRHYYGPGGKHLVDYLRFYHRDLKAKGATYYGSGQQERFYDRAFVEQAENYFRKAFQASGSNPVYRLRLEKTYTTVQMMRMLLARRESPGSPEFIRARDDFKKSCDKFKFSLMAEHKTLKVFLDEISFVLKDVPEFCRNRIWITGIPSVRTSNRWASRIDDPTACMGRAALLRTFHNAWAIYCNTNSLPGFNSPVRYDVYVRIKVIPESGASPDTEAFSCGAYLEKNNIYSKLYTLGKCRAGEWSYMKVADHIPVTATGSVWIAPRSNQDKVKELRIDHFLFVRSDPAGVTGNNAK